MLAERETRPGEGKKEKRVLTSDSSNIAWSWIWGCTEKIGFWFQSIVQPGFNASWTSVASDYLEKMKSSTAPHHERGSERRPNKNRETGEGAGTTMPGKAWLAVQRSLRGQQTGRPTSTLFISHIFLCAHMGVHASHNGCSVPWLGRLRASGPSDEGNAVTAQLINGGGAGEGENRSSSERMRDVMMVLRRPTQDASRIAKDACEGAE